MSQWMPGYRFQYQVPPKSPPVSTTRTDSTPRWRIRAPARMPPNPPPTTATSTVSCSGSRSAVSPAYGSAA
ncbi:hypothetical protein SHIRM173S_06265 [Streptomyces hirsutus]